MDSLLSSERVREIYGERDGLVCGLIHDRLESLRRFIQLIETYDGSKDVFRLIIIESMARFDVRARQLAELCNTSHTTVVRWTKDTLPTELARVEAIKRLTHLLERRRHELEQAFPTETAEDADERAMPW